MVTIYLIRHCEAEGNLTGRFQGQIDCDITKTGEIQLKYLAKKFKDVQIDGVYASPLTRAYKTAMAIAEAKRLPVVTDERLKELNIGILENVPFEELKTKYVDYREKWVNTPWNFEVPEGESMRVLYERVWEATKEIAEQNEGKTVVIASHGCAIRNLLCRVLYNDIKCLLKVKIVNNTAVTKLVFDENMNVVVEYYADCSHLPAEALPESSRFDTNLGDKK